MADVLRMPEPQPQAEQQTVLSVEMPARGMTMERVEDRVGTMNDQMQDRMKGLDN